MGQGKWPVADPARGAKVLITLLINLVNSFL